MWIQKVVDEKLWWEIQSSHFVASVFLKQEAISKAKRMGQEYHEVKEEGNKVKYYLREWQKKMKCSM